MKLIGSTLLLLGINGETCVTLDSSRYTYRRLESTRARLDLILENDNTSNYALYDESTVKVNYSGCSLTNVQQQYPVESAVIDNTQTQLIFDFSEKESGKRRLGYEYRWQADATCTFASVDLCKGVSPTAGSLTFHSYISSHDCQQLETNIMTVPNVWLGRAYMRTWFRGTVANSIKAGDYVELEFSGPVEFSNIYYPIAQAVNVQDNVWRLFFEANFPGNNFYFESEVKFTGSTFHKPNLNWIQKCTADSLNEDGTAKSLYGASSDSGFSIYSSFNYDYSWGASKSEQVDVKPTQAATTRRPTTARPAPIKVLEPVVTRPKKSQKFKKEPKKRLKKNGTCCRLTKAQREAKRLKKLQGRINRQIKHFGS